MGPCPSSARMPCHASTYALSPPKRSDPSSPTTIPLQNKSLSSWGLGNCPRHSSIFSVSDRLRKSRADGWFELPLGRGNLFRWWRIANDPGDLSGLIWKEHCEHTCYMNGTMVDLEPLTFTGLFVLSIVAVPKAGS